ncbi:hypothetical protein AUJ83_02480 [Candidatus Woesearchaeota archaeon CG1_02_33_12]|nr:MAG: hypothetical protein AUJ83_02480 [Candidatus Woesearchaeota archaeon CG1_02_33_12]PIN78485.1 MAG: hypothetical protein COV14_03595 [Candidatus Woesearchaeota archaeon CG10_big_fil_rev_8_21_14_0_10_33_12]
MVDMYGTIFSIKVNPGVEYATMLASYVRDLAENREKIPYNDLIKKEGVSDEIKNKIEAIGIHVRYHPSKSIIKYIPNKTLLIDSLEVIYDPCHNIEIINGFYINPSKMKPFNKKKGYIYSKKRLEIFIRERMKDSLFRKKGIIEVEVKNLDGWYREIQKEKVILFDEEQIKKLEDILKINKKYNRWAKEQGW